MRKRHALAICLLGVLNLSLANAQVVVGGEVSQALSNLPGDPVRGRAIVANRQTGLCLLCHSGPFPEERFQGNLAPDLTISAANLTIPQLRARIMDASRFNPNTIMPSYYRDDHLYRVALKFKGQTILSGQEIEDVVAFLASMDKQNAK
jgi:L-cysteine S-thiosulfotransferase